MPREPKVKKESQGSRVCTSCNKVKLLSQFETLKRGKYAGYVSSALPSKKQEKPLPPLSRTSEY
jgi:hypothetical protein